MRNRTRIGGMAVLLAGVGALVAGCGGGSSSATPAAASSPSGRSEEIAVYVACLQKNGVDAVMPSGGVRISGSPRTRPSGAPSGVRPSRTNPTARPSGGFGGGPGGMDALRPSGVDDATWQKAQQACASVLPSFGPRGQGSDNGAMRAYVNCLQQHGVTVTGGIRGLNTADPKFAAADKVCGVLKPTATPAPSN